MRHILPHSSRYSKKTEGNIGGRKYKALYYIAYKPGVSDLKTINTFIAVLATLIVKNNSVIKYSVERNKHERNKKQDMVYCLNKKSFRTAFWMFGKQVSKTQGMRFLVKQ